MGGPFEAPHSKELQHQAVDRGGALEGRPVAGPGNPVNVECATHRLPNLPEQEVGGPERGIVALAPQHPDPATELTQIVQERSPAAHLAAVESGVAYTVGLDVHRFLGGTRGIAEHVDQEVVAADLAEERVVPLGALVAPGRPVAEASGGEARGRDQTQVGYPGREAPGEVG